MNKNGIAEKRRRIYSALAHHLKHDRLLEALWLWEQKYALTSGLELRKYVSELMTENDSPQLKSAIYKSLTKATYFPGESELLPDPYNEMQQYRERCHGKFKFISPFDNQASIPFSTTIFQRCLEVIFNQVKRNNVIAYQHLAQKAKIILPGMELNEAQQKELTSWLDNQNDSLRLLYPENFMSALVSSFYKVCCEQFGPVTADKILAKAIEDADELEEAKFFNPHRLL